MRSVVRKRYEKLAELLERNARNAKGARFDLGTVGRWDPTKKAPEMDCGTVGCAIGLAAVARIIPGFKYSDATLGLEYKGEGIGFSEVAYKLFDADKYTMAALFLPTRWWGGLATTDVGGERNVAKAIRYFLKHGLPESGRWDGVLKNPARL